MRTKEEELSRVSGESDGLKLYTILGTLLDIRDILQEQSKQKVQHHEFGLTEEPKRWSDITN